MPAASETRPALERRLAEGLLGFEVLDEAWPCAPLCKGAGLTQIFLDLDPCYNSQRPDGIIRDMLDWPRAPNF